MQKIKKILGVVSEIFKDRRTDGPTDGEGRLLRTPSGKPGVQNGNQGETSLLPSFLSLDNLNRLVRF